MKFKIAIVILLFLFLASFLGYQYFQFHDGKLHVVFCNVGQGDGIFVRTPNGSDILVDAGPDNSILNCLEKHMPLWDRSIELAFATHPDADHIGGFRYVLKNYTVGSFNTSQKTSDTKVFAALRSLISQGNIPMKYLFKGDTYKVSDGVEVTDFWPTHAYVSSSNINSDTNSFSLVQILSYGKFKVLLTGDIEAAILDTLFKNGLSVSVFKIPHHGSKTGVDDTTFQEIHSQFIPISVGLHNRYHHPSPTVLELLKKYHESYQRTDQVGDIEVVTDGENWHVIGGH